MAKYEHKEEEDKGERKKSINQEGSEIREVFNKIKPFVEKEISAGQENGAH